MRRGAEACVVVFAPSPLLTVTVEARGEEPDVHLHAGGQGFWTARMVAALGVQTTLCGSFGGETGAVVRTLMEREGVRVVGVETVTGNPAYVHDRRSGARSAIAEMPVTPLSRHEVDELYGVTLVEALQASVCLLAGSTAQDAVPSDTYRHLAVDLRTNGGVVVADLAGEQRQAALDGGVSVLKVSHEELLVDGVASSDSDEELVDALARLRQAGAEEVVISRAERPALATHGGAPLEVLAPQLEPLDVHGAGDSMTAGIAAALARGEEFDVALCLGAAAGALNVTRRGLATGHRPEIERLAAQVALRPIAVEPGPGENGRDMSPEELAARARPR